MSVSNAAETLGEFRYTSNAPNAAETLGEFRYTSVLLARPGCG
jgi:hypothetical protein